MEFTTDIELTIKARDLALLIADRASALVALADSEEERNRVGIELAQTERTLDSYRDRNGVYAEQSRLEQAQVRELRGEVARLKAIVLSCTPLPEIGAFDLAVVLNRHAPLDAIKAIRAATNCGLKEAKDYYDIAVAKGMFVLRDAVVVMAQNEAAAAAA